MLKIKLERFDYKCTGEEAGQFCDVSIESLIADIGRIADKDEIVLTGLRLGATLAFMYALKNPDRIKKIIMISPIINGTDYVEHICRKQKLKNIITSNCDISPQGEGFINIEGYKTSRLFLEQVKRINLTKYDFAHTHKKTTISVLNTINSMTNNTEVYEFVESLQKNGFKVNSKSIEFPPIWERIGLMDYKPLIEPLMEMYND